MTRLRLQLAAFTTLAAIVVMTGAPLAQALHQDCLLHHECGATAKMSTCCCEDRSAQSESTPVPTRVDIRADDSALAALPHGAHLALPSAVARPVHTSPPRLCRLDLPTLFAALLI